MMAHLGVPTASTAPPTTAVPQTPAQLLAPKESVPSPTEVAAAGQATLAAAVSHTPTEAADSPPSGQAAKNEMEELPYNPNDKHL